MALATVLAGPASAEELILLTWSEYLAPELIDEFEKESGATLKIVIFELDEARDSLLVTNGPAAYDLMVLGGSSIAAYARRGWLEPIDKAAMPNLVHLKPFWVSAHDQSEAYGVPYFWGTTGIAYRSDLVAEPFHSWRQLLQPEEALRGRIAMMGAGRDLISPALKMLGKSLNFTDPSVIQSAEAVLRAQKPFVKTYVYLSMTPESTLVTGEVWAALAYNGGAKTLQGFEPAIRYVVPDEGANLYADYLTISSESTKKQLAAQFIDFLNRPDVAARNALFVKYASPNRAAEALLPKEFLEDPAIYPSESVLQRSEIYDPLSARAYKSFNASMIRLMN
jgi:spermidine/putrescine transport system substrate-binding protein